MELKTVTKGHAYPSPHPARLSPQGHAYPLHTACLSFPTQMHAYPHAHTQCVSVPPARGMHSLSLPTKPLHSTSPRPQFPAAPPGGAELPAPPPAPPGAALLGGGRGRAGPGRAAKMAEPSGPGAEGAEPGPGAALIRVTVKTPKDKEEIVIGDGASVREVRPGPGALRRGRG